MSILYSGTRGSETVSACEAVLRGLAPDGGLYAPANLPAFTLEEIQSLSALAYPQRAVRVLAPFFSQISEDELNEMCCAAAERSDTDKVAPLNHISRKVSILELFHGPTLAFKDMALTLLPHLMRASARITGREGEILLLTATSGDTGKAALEGFRDVPGTRCVVYYPENGVSALQRLQMVTQRGENAHVIAVRGNFDDAQSGVKRIFSDPKAREKLAATGRSFSSANSINFGRLAPQIVYYFSSYVDLVEDGKIKLGDKVNFVVPTGNFGDILAGWYAKKMGLPVNKLICASNTNKVLTDFFETGVYDANRPFKTTSSPSMDILISSNLERLLYHCTDGDVQRVAGWMDELASRRKFQVDADVLERITEDFWAGWADENSVRWEITCRFQEDKALIDPHTAVGSRVLRDYWQETGDNTYAVLLSTASPYKFARTVSSALLPYAGGDDFALCERMSKMSGMPLPASVPELKELPVRHTMTCEPVGMEKALFDALP